MFAGVALTPATGAPERETDQDTKPNFLLIQVDDLDFDELGIYWDHDDAELRTLPTFTRAERLGLAHQGKRGQSLGYSKVGPMVTPNIDRLAEEGVIFSRYYVTSPICTPSRFSLMTGRYASRSQTLRLNTPEGEPPLIAFNTPLDRELTLPERLQPLGYVTGHVGKWHNFGSQNSNRGNGHVGNFARLDPQDPVIAEQLKAGIAAREEELRANHNFDFVGALYPGNVDDIGIPKRLFEASPHNMEWIVAAARTFLARHNQQPFMLHVATTAPHGWMNRIGNDEDKVLTPAGILDSPPAAGMPSRESVYERNRKNRSGRAMAIWLDDAVGALLDDLDRYGIQDNTIVIFTSDHGNRGKESVYEAARSPLLIRWPTVIERGRISRALVSNIDLAPTILELAGGRLRNEFDGVSLSPILRERESEVRDSLMLEVSLSRAVVTKDWKYLVHRPPREIAARIEAEASLDPEDRIYGWDGNWRRDSSGNWRTPRQIKYRNHLFFPAYFEKDQLYDLAKDNMEQVNLYTNEEFAAKGKELEKKLSELLRQTDQPLDWFFP
ncbi:MAG: sulfatase-like hydrolase/transferase [Pseudomonadota bacterium]